MNHYAVIERDTQRIILVFGSYNCHISNAVRDAAKLTGSTDVGVQVFSGPYYDLNPNYLVRPVSYAPR